MIAKTLISAEVPPLKTSFTGDDALQMMSDYHVRHLPIVNNEQLLGLLAEDDIWHFDPDEAIGSYELSLTRPYVLENDHLYAVMRQLHDHKLTLIPVVNHHQKYLGSITLYDLLRCFAESASFAQQGAVVVLEINKHSYSLSQIARIVEAENTAILNSFVTSQRDTTEIEVTLKLNRSDIQRILASFVRFGYTIKASFSEEEYIDSLKHNYDMLMNYLNV